MQLGSRNHLKMLLATVPAPNRGQVRSRVLRQDKGTIPKSTFWAENVGPGADYGSDLGPQMAPKTRWPKMRPKGGFHATALHRVSHF